MALKKNEVVDLIEVIESGIVQVRTAIRILENDVVISSSFTRHVIIPGQDYSHETNRVKAVCVAVHDAFTVDAYKAAIAAQGV